MKKLKNIALMLSIGALTATLPYTSYSTQALPINDVNEKEIKAPLDIFNLENKNTKRNQKEEMWKVFWGYSQKDCMREKEESRSIQLLT